ncbi:sensor histidine kinase [Diplocloster modestus]|uniref:Histidine kinase n=1 Tax=Diplocloster modestus TaxID=2850322 RepID=A0ABS6KEZ1_9FIRM|nr:histidine kinase [Diplocloster modestus]MBU9729092.1 histidine kinase [Diplocloster modestus]
MKKKYKSLKVKLFQRIEAIVAISLSMAIIISFFTIQPILSGQTLDQCEQATRQMTELLENTFDPIVNYADTITYSRDLKYSIDKYLAYPSSQYNSQLQLNLSEFSNNLSYVRGLMLELPNQERVFSISNIYDEDLQIIKSNWYKETEGTYLLKKFSDFYTTVQTNATADTREAISCVYCLNFEMKARSYRLVVFFDVSNLIRSFDNIAAAYLDDYTLISSDGHPQPLLGNNILLSNDLDFRDPTSYEELTDGRYFHRQSNYAKWAVLTYISNKSINRAYRLLLIFIVLIYVFMSGLTLLLSRFSFAQYVVPITKLSQTMIRISKGDWKAQAKIQTGDEIEDLANVFNEMLNNLNYYFNISLEQEKQQQYMRYNLLISQLDPHFIYNVMSIINVLAKRAGNKDIVDINTALIHLLQDRLRISNTEIFDTVQQEIHALEQYIFLANYKFGKNAVKVNWHIDETVLNDKIPKIILSTLVENSFKHAFVETTRKNILDIRIQKENKAITIIVHDNGIGMDAATLATLNASTPVQTSPRGMHIGISSMKQILQYLYKDNISICFSSEPDKGTTVRILFL